MPILSEGAGVMIWLKRRGNDALFSGYLLKLFNNQTKESFYRITFNSCDSKKFQRFTTWYSIQNLETLKTEFKEYRKNKLESKKQEMEKYFASDEHLFILKNKEMSRNQIYKMLNKKVRWNKFVDNYKKSKTKF